MGGGIYFHRIFFLTVGDNFRRWWTHVFFFASLLRFHCVIRIAWLRLEWETTPDGLPSFKTENNAAVTPKGKKKPVKHGIKKPRKHTKKTKLSRVVSL